MSDLAPNESPKTAIPIAPALDLFADTSPTPAARPLVDRRVAMLCLVAMGLGILAAVASEVLLSLIALITNFSFFGRLSLEHTSPSENTLGLWVIVVPVVGALIVGLMARYGSKAIRGHGIPEAMEQVLTNRSRIPARLTLLKPLSAAVSIGTGGPFGAEGPIIATGGALGSVLGQFVSTTPAERKTLLSAGAAAGMAATFGSPVSAVLLAVELLLFEFRARSIVPVALASTMAAGMRIYLEGSSAVFAMPNVPPPGLTALALYVVIGALMGLVAAVVTRVLYRIEDGFEKLPIHWMWWPALGAVVVGVVGYFSPETLGVGYQNISNILSGNLTAQAILFLGTLKFISWSIALGSGTSGGTLAPLMTIGSGIGYLLGAGAAAMLPAAGVDLRVAALVGMAALFAGASRAWLASVVFAFETTLQPMSLLPLLGGCAMAYFVSCLVMRHTIMTERIARRGIRAPAEYTADPLEQVVVTEVATSQVVALDAEDHIQALQEWIASGVPGSTHQGFPVLDSRQTLVGVITRRDILAANGDENGCVSDLIRRMPKFVYTDCTVRQAVDHMLNHGIGRLPVMSKETPPRLKGMISRSDILACYRRNIEEHRPEAPTIVIPNLRRRLRQPT